MNGDKKPEKAAGAWTQIALMVMICSSCTVVAPVPPPTGPVVPDCQLTLQLTGGGKSTDSLNPS